MSRTVLVPINTSDLPDNIRPVVTTIDTIFDEIYLVGGAVRDALLNRETNDLDFATPLTVMEIEELLTRNNLFKLHREGIEFGTIAARIGDFDIQISSYRTEQYASSSRKPTVNLISDIDSDLSRRDFTMNTIALSNTELIDPYDGVEDIKKGIIRSVGNVDLKFREDPLRILRAFRFVAELGFSIEERTLESAIENHSNLRTVSVERIGSELSRIVSGEFWDDAVSELAESRILNTILRSLDLTYGVSAEDVYYEFSDYTAEQLRDMSIPARWYHLISIINHSKEVAGVESIDLQTLAEKVLVGAQLPKNDKTKIIEYIGNVSKGKHSKKSDTTKDVEELLREAESQKKRDDPRWMINMASYYTLRGKESLSNSHYKRAVNHLRHAIRISQENQQYIIENFSDPTEKKNKLKGLNNYLRSRIRYFVLASIFADKLYIKFNSTKSLIAYILKELRFNGISAESMREMTEHVVASVYKRNPPGITLEPFMEYLKGDLRMEQEQIIRYKRSFIESQIRNSNIPPEDKAVLYLEKAELSKESSDTELGFEYYDPFIDYLFNTMISQSRLDGFNRYYDQFVETANEYLTLSYKWRRLTTGKRNMYLTSASAITHAIQICDSLDGRISLSQRVVDDYSEGRDYRSARRYQIYVDWFRLAKLIFEAESIEKDLRLLLEGVRGLSSVNYVDEDEAYLSQHRPDLVRKRNLIQDVLYFLQLVSTSDAIHDITMSDEVLKALSILVLEKSIDKDNAFIIMKNRIARIEKEVGRIDTITDVPDKVLAKDNNSMIDQLLSGESEMLEYKSTWCFELDPYRHSDGKIKRNSPELKKEVVKNIAGMLNKNGGTILIGVEDDGTVCGLEEGDFMMQSNKDPRKKIDNIQLDIGNEIKARLKKEIFAKLSINTLTYKYQDERKTILKIEVPKSVTGPVIYREHEEESYFVRSGTSTTNAGMTAHAEAFRDQSRPLQETDAKS